MIPLIEIEKKRSLIGIIQMQIEKESNIIARISFIV